MNNLQFKALLDIIEAHTDLHAARNSSDGGLSEQIRLNNLVDVFKEEFITKEESDEPFGRQPQPVVASFNGDLRDVETYIQKFTRIIEQGSYNTVTRMGNQLKIHPRAVND